MHPYCTHTAAIIDRIPTATTPHSTLRFFSTAINDHIVVLLELCFCLKKAYTLESVHKNNLLADLLGARDHQLFALVDLPGVHDAWQRPLPLHTRLHVQLK